MIDIKTFESDMYEKGIYLFMSRVTDELVVPVIEWIISENIKDLQHRKEYLTLIICSPGGAVQPCFALIDIMTGSCIPIRTVGIGEIASAGLLMFIAGDPGTRTLTPNTRILSHQYSWGSSGKEHELLGRMREFDLLTKRMVRHYKKFTGLTEKEIREHLLPASDVWLDATQALKLGICDKVKLAY